jgi:RNA polymerase sigma factor (sigma-70 family)
MAPQTTPTENELIEKHTGLVVAQAAMFNPTTLSDFDDYVSSGRIGLLKAIRHFDPDRNTKFSTYAAICIRREMIREVQRDKDQKTLRVNENHTDKERPLELWEILPDNLDDIEKKVLEARILQNCTLKEIGECFGHSKQWVSTILKRIILKIREGYER